MLTLENLQKIACEAMSEALAAHDPNPDEASDGGQAARYWERLSDAADALVAVKMRQAALQAGDPPEAIPA